MMITHDLVAQILAVVGVVWVVGMLFTNPRHAYSHLAKRDSASLKTVRTQRRGHLLQISEAAMFRGLVTRGMPGTGKTVLVAIIAYGNLLKKKPQLIIDAKGALKRILLKLILRNPEPLRSELLSRLRIWPVGHPTKTYSLPWLYPPGTHDQRAARLLDVTLKIVPDLATRPIAGLPSLYAVGMPVLTILSALDFQVTEVIDMLYDLREKGGKWSQLLREAENLVPETVRLFRKTYMQWKDNEKRLRQYALESNILPYLYSDTLRAIVGSNEVPDLGGMEEEGITFLVVTSGLEEEKVEESFIVHLFNFFTGYIKRRGVGKHLKPWFLICEETGILIQSRALIPDMQALANEYRNNRLQPLISFQSIHQLPRQMQELLYSYGNHWVGRTGGREESDIEADFILRFNPQMVKHPGYPSYSFAPFPFIDVVQTGHNNPIYYPLEEQRRMLSDYLMQMKGREFCVVRYTDETMKDSTVYWVEQTVELPDLSGVTEEDILAAEEENLATYAQDVQAILKEIDDRLPRRAGSPGKIGKKKPAKTTTQPPAPKQLE